MPRGLIRTGVAIPRFRLTAAELEQTWGVPANGEAAVCYHDEDATTLAIEAAERATADGEVAFDAVVVATLSPAFSERSTAAQVAVACDRRPPVIIDVGGGRRAGVGALGQIAAGGSGTQLVVMTDVREAGPKSPMEGQLGAGAVAFLISDDSAAGALVVSAKGAFGCYADVWRQSGRPFVDSDPSKRALDEGTIRPLVEVIRATLADARRAPRDISHLALGGVDARTARVIAKATEIDASALVGDLRSELGDLGVASAPMALVAAIERARAGQSILVAASGDGADAVLLDTTSRIDSLRPSPSLAQVVERRAPIPSYGRWLAWRGLIGDRPDAPRVSPVLLDQDEPWLLRRRGTRCSACGRVSTPPSDTCQGCRSRDVHAHRLASRGTVFTFTRDRLFSAVEPETGMVVVDLADKGRVFVQATDVAPHDIHIGMAVELVHRQMWREHGLPVYGLKARPIGDLA